MTQKTKTGVPIYLFLPYLAFYTTQAIYGTYFNKYLQTHGFTTTQMGMITSITTIVVLLITPFWGIVSDRSRSKNSVVKLLLLLSAVSILGYYLDHLFAGNGTILFLFMMAVNSIFCMTYRPVTTLLDNITLESLNERKGKLNFGHVRIAGTVGYSLAAVAAGWLMHDDYRRMFWMVSAMLLLTFVVFLQLPKVAGVPSKKDRHDFGALLKEKRILAFIFLNVVNFMSMQIYYGYYSLYFTNELGGDSALLGWLMFATALPEIPIWFFAGKIVEKFGYRNTMMASVCATGLRWTLLFFVRDPFLAILVNTMHGLCFVMLNYSMLTFINENVPKDLRATGQSLSGMIQTIFSSVIGGVVMGRLCELYGVRQMLLACGMACFIATFIFYFLYNALAKLDAKNGAVIDGGGD